MATGESKTTIRLQEIQTQIGLMSGEIGKLTVTVDSIRDDVDESKETLQGKGTTPGLVTMVALISAKLDAMSTGAAIQAVPRRNPERGEGGSSRPSTRITKAYVVDKFGAPVLVAFLVWFLIDLLPILLAHLAQAGSVIK